MIISSTNVMKYTPILLLSVLSVLLIPVIQNAHAQNPLDQLIGGIKNLTSGASKAVNNTAKEAGQAASNASKSANSTASKAGQSVSNAASNASKSANSTASKSGNSSVGAALENTSKAVGNALQKGISGIMNLGNQKAK
jgi:hypothetical protein